MKTTILHWQLIGCLLIGLFGPAHLVRAADDAKPEAADNAELPLEELQTFTNVFGQIRNKYVEQVDDKTLLRNAIRGMLDGLDPHSVYLDNEAFEDLQEHTNGEFGGLGLEVSMEDGFVRVIAPIDDTPAEKAGILAGDLIIKLDDRSVKGLSLPEAIALMRGPANSKIKLTIAREGGPPFELTLTRAIIEVKSVKSRELEPGYGYLRISQFQNNSGTAARRKLQKMLKADPEMKGLVLDLRNNPGGVLQAAVQVTDLFIEDGLIVYTEGRTKEVDTRYNSETPDMTGGIPVVVLVNGGSASASEIVAGALQDHRRALIVGTETFGKGSVQSVLPLSKEHAIKLTTALYYTPDGRSIQAQGIIPDIEIRPAKITPIKQSVVGMTEADLNKRLDNAKGGEDHTYSKRMKQKGSQLSRKDNQLYDALNLLKGISIASRDRAKTTTASAK